MHSNFRLTKWNIYKDTFKVILINVPLALPARCSKIIRRPYLQLELVKLPIAAGVLSTVKILVQRMATFLLVQRMATAFPEPPAVTQVLAEAQEPGQHQPSTATAEQLLAKGNI